VRLFDGHCDTAFALWQKNETLTKNTCHIDLSRVAAFDGYAQVFAFCSNVGEGYAQSPQDLLTLPLEHFLRQPITIAKTPQELLSALSEKRAVALLSLEGPEGIDCEPGLLPQLRQTGFVMSTLTWNADNALAGCHFSEDVGLHAKGKDFVRLAQELGILIDVSHLSQRAFWDLCAVTQKPILASHSNCRALCDNSRNLSDDQLRAIAESGGTVGLNLYRPFLGGKADFPVLRAHLEHMLLLCGEKQVALGGDLDGCSALAAGFSDVRGYEDFYRYLQNCGYSEALLDGVFFTNLLRLLSAQ
jgi:membrane dipeptidase